MGSSQTFAGRQDLKLYSSFADIASRFGLNQHQTYTVTPREVSVESP